LKRLFAILACIAVATLAAGCSNGGSVAPVAPQPPPGPQIFAVTTGGSALSQAVQAFDYYPNQTTIDVGDSITWNNTQNEPHVVAIPPAGQTPPPGPPQPPVGGKTFDGSSYISSGFMAPNSTYTVKFTKAGTYTVYCLIHQPEMVSTIVVQPAGTAYPKSQGQYLAEGAADLSYDLGVGTASIATFPYPAGGTHLAAGISPGLAAGPPAQTTVMRFMDAGNLDGQPLNTTIPVGTTLTWTNQANNAPHTVSFPVAGQALPPGPPDGPAAGGATYDGTAYTSSGVIPPGGSYSLTFTARGTYTYYCQFHAPEGMTGTVTVQ
jgi:plastocyanin